MRSMFSSATSFNGDISRWAVSSVTNMKNMCINAKMFTGKGDSDPYTNGISKWDVSGVTNMNNMFSSAASFNGDISKWDVSCVTDMNKMFSSASSFDGDISQWDVSTGDRHAGHVLECGIVQR